MPKFVVVVSLVFNADNEVSHSIVFVKLNSQYLKDLIPLSVTTNFISNHWILKNTFIFVKLEILIISKTLLPDFKSFKSPKTLLFLSNLKLFKVTKFFFSSDHLQSQKHFYFLSYMKRFKSQKTLLLLSNLKSFKSYKNTFTFVLHEIT